MTLSQSQREYDAALSLVRVFARSSDRAKIEEGFDRLVSLATKYPRSIDAVPPKWAVSKAKELIEDVFPESGRPTDAAIKAWLCELVERFSEKAEGEWFENALAVTAHESTPTRRQQRPVDEKKALIARLKANYRNQPARKICESIDQTIDRTAPIIRERLAPLEQWRKLVPSARSWVRFFDDPKTHNLVRSYVNKVPPLKVLK
jgi:hypothetical protein